MKHPPVRSETIEILKIEIPRKYFWLILLAMTIAHWYCTILFVRDCYRIFYGPDEVRRIAFNTLSLTGSLFFKGLIPRLCNGGQYIPIYDSDPTGWLSQGSALAIFLSVIRWRNVKWATRIFSVAMAIALTVANWSIGTTR